MTFYNPLHLFPLPPTLIDPQPWPTALTVDAFSDILWVGSSSGLVSALHTPLSLHRNVQFPVGAPKLQGVFMQMNDGVKEIRATDRDVWTLTEGGIGGRKRGGAPKWTVQDKLRSLNTMAPNPVNSHEVVAGGTGQMVLANTSRGEIVRSFDTPSPIVKLFPQQRSVVCASLSGQVSVLDPRTGFRPAAGITSAQAHTGGLSGADLQGALIATWGWTHRQGHPFPDPLVRLYDVRTLRALPPVSFSEGAAFCLLHPTDPLKMVICSQQGTLQAVDTSESSAGTLQQLDVQSFVTSMALSPMGDYLAFGESNGTLHLWTNHDVSESAPRGEDGQLYLPPFNGYEGVPPEWPDNPDPPPYVQWKDTTPLNIIGLPQYSEPLLSNFPNSDYATRFSPFYNPPEPIPPAIQIKLQLRDGALWGRLGPDDKGINRLKARPGAGGQKPGKGTAAHRRDSAPRFRSEKRQRDSIAHEDEVGPGLMPKYYKKVEIKYSKFGIEDFDFGYYNRTPYSGLETDILNSYTNALLQALHYTLPLRAVAKAHICVDCKKEHCLLCEAGFLFRMLEDAQGTNCQASNFSRAFSATPQASALGLLDADANAKSTSPYGSLIQNFNRWLLSTFSTESVVEGETFDLLPRSDEMDGLSLSDRSSAIDQVLGIKVRTTNRCKDCNFVSTRESTLHAVDLQYPKSTPAADLEFSSVLRSSIIRETSTKASCSRCKHFAWLVSSRTLAPEANSLPPVLTVNAMVTSNDIAEIWQDRADGSSFLSPTLSFSLGSDGQLLAEEGPDALTYQIRSLVVQVTDEADAPSHLVSLVKIPQAEESGPGEWVMFNDFVVRPVSEEAALSFAADWKTPAVLIFERVDSHTALDLSRLPTSLDTEILFQDVSLAWNRKKDRIKHELLARDELPSAGTHIAIDAEFVALQQEEMEFRSDGTKNILRPSHMSLARVSVLRGEGPKEGEPFIDDYIHTKETVVDYLTEFSGIKSGDLDPGSSVHTLVPLKVAYKKLRLLVDLGCIFIGHGLAKDFRTINIFVPPSQVMDTVNLFTLPGRQRKLSLRYLSWYLLKKDIQGQVHGHDSIEDAEYALLLYQLYLQHLEAGDFDEVMEDVFEQGFKYGFKVPQDKTNSPMPTTIPLGPPQSPSPIPTAPRLTTPRGQGRARKTPAHLRGGRGSSTSLLQPGDGSPLKPKSPRR